MIETIKQELEKQGQLINDIKKKVEDGLGRGYIDMQEAMEYTGYSYEFLIRKKGEIGYYSRGRKVLFKKEDIDAWFDKLKVKDKI